MPNAPSLDSRTSPVGHLWGGGVLTLYVLLIAYASLYPFAGWRIPPEAWWQNLWSRYNPEFDVVINFISYAPLGFLAASAWSRRFTAFRAMVLAILSGAALSMAMEGVQLFLPTRVTSLLDWLSNTAGATVGVLLCLNPVGLRLRAFVHGWRLRFFLAGAAVDAGLILIVIWLLAQTNASVPFFEAGNMINRLTASWRVNPYDPLFLIPQLVGIGLNVCGFALFVSVLVKTQVRSMLVVAVVLAMGLALKLTAAGLMLKAPLLENWLGPASVLGLGAGLVAALPLLAATRRLRIFLALLLVFAGGLMSKMASIYDAFDETLRLFDWHYGQLSNFASLTRSLSEVWPLLVLAFLAYCYVRRPSEDLQ